MGLAASAQKVVDALLSRSGSAGRPYPSAQSLDNPDLVKRRKALGNHLALRPEFQTQWLMWQREQAIQNTTNGDLRLAALLSKIIQTDPVFNGALSTLVSAILCLPRKFRGCKEEYIHALELGHDSIRSVFDEMVQQDQLRLFVKDKIMVGTSLAEFVDIPGRNFPSFQRLDPTWMRYRWADQQGNWWYNSALGPIAIFGGDGRWVHWSNGTDSPWEQGLWLPNSQVYIQKFTCIVESMNFERSLANPAILLEAPLGASDADRLAWQLAWEDWAVNTVMQGPPGYTGKLVESTGTGWQAFQKTIGRCNEEFIISVAGQLPATLGNTGFGNSILQKDIKQDKIRDMAKSLQDLINLQILPQWTVRTYGPDAIEDSPQVEFDVTVPQDLVQVSQAWTQLSDAIPKINKGVLKRANREVDVDEIIAKYRIPTKLIVAPARENLVEDESFGESFESTANDVDASVPIVADSADLAALGEALNKIADAAQKLGVEVETVDIFNAYGLKAKRKSSTASQITLAPTDIAKVVRKDEAREGQGLSPIGGDEGSEFVATDKTSSEGQAA